MDERPTPLGRDIPGAFPITPSTLSLRTANTQPSFYEEATESSRSSDNVRLESPRPPPPPSGVPHTTSYGSTSSSSTARPIEPVERATQPETPTEHEQSPATIADEQLGSTKTASDTQYHVHDERPLSAVSADTASTESSSEDDEEVVRADSKFMPLKTGASTSQSRPGMPSRKSIVTEEDLFRVLSRRRTSMTGKSEVETEEEQAEIERLMSRMFGKARQEHSEEEKTRHVGVVFRDLTVKGVGLGAALQRTNGDVFMGLPRLLQRLLKGGAKAAAGKPAVRDLLSDFNGCIRPGEMLLVLGRPGSGCSTFLKVLGNQRSGFEAVEGDVTYGGTTAEQMAKNFRGEVLYNPEDDLHYATLTVKNTLEFALRTRTPGKESRNEGESRQEYVREFLRVVTKLFWIEHTLGTKVGDEFVRGVSGGEKKRVSIAEAMITRASVQAWDNSTRGLDASTALEYVESIRSLTNMAHVSTAVALYQAGESLFQLFDKVLLIDEGQCLYYGSADHAKKYFEDLGFTCPERWTTADFLTSVSDKHERSVKDGWEDRIPRSAEEFATAYRKSDAYQRNIDDMRSFEEELETKRRDSLIQKGKQKQKNYTISFPKQVWACTQRQVLVILGDRASLYGKWGGIIFQSIIVGSLFYNMPKTSLGAFTRGGVMFFLLLFNALLALAEMTAAFQSKPILLKHKSFSFYRPAAYALAQTVVDIPLVLVQVLLFTLPIYFMSDLQRTGSQFFIAILILWLTTMIMYSFFRMLAALCKSLDIASRFTGLASTLR